jgi:1-acyl-sn-glycerol-3-phosphate acyltransferase
MDAPTTRWRPPLIWRALMLLARLATSLVCRLRVTGEAAPALRRGPLIVASNHIGVFDRWLW